MPRQAATASTALALLDIAEVSLCPPRRRSDDPARTGPATTPKARNNSGSLAAGGHRPASDAVVLTPGMFDMEYDDDDTPPPPHVPSTLSHTAAGLRTQAPSSSSSAGPSPQSAPLGGTSATTTTTARNNNYMRGRPHGGALAGRETPAADASWLAGGATVSVLQSAAAATVSGGRWTSCESGPTHRGSRRATTGVRSTVSRSGHSRPSAIAHANALIVAKQLSFVEATPGYGGQHHHHYPPPEDGSATSSNGSFSNGSFPQPSWAGTSALS